MATALQTDGRVVISWRILLASDTEKINPQAMELVNKLADVMKKYPNLNGLRSDAQMTLSLPGLLKIDIPVLDIRSDELNAEPVTDV